MIVRLDGRYKVGWEGSKISGINEQHTPSGRFYEVTLKTQIPMATSSASLLQIIVAIIFPPVAVAMHSGISKEFWICLILTLLFFVPGMIYALLVIMK